MILISFVANLPSRYGSPLQTLQAAIKQLDVRSDINIVSVSDIYLTAPVPVSDQPWYHNGVLSVETDLAPRQLLAVLQSVEAEFGRERGERNAARVLDLDILAYNDEILDEEGLILPHPRMSSRAFVLYPLRDVAPLWRHPVSLEGVGAMIAGLPADQDIRKVEHHDAKAG